MKLKPEAGMNQQEAKSGRRSKVWGGLTCTALKPSANGGMQARTIVRARSQRQAVEMLCVVPNNRCFMSLHYFREYWSETGNPEELKVADGLGVWSAQVVTLGTETARWKRLWPVGTSERRKAECFDQMLEALKGILPMAISYYRQTPSAKNKPILERARECIARAEAAMKAEAQQP